MNVYSLEKGWDGLSTTLLCSIGHTCTCIHTYLLHVHVHVLHIGEINVYEEKKPSVVF